MTPDGWQWMPGMWARRVDSGHPDHGAVTFVWFGRDGPMLDIAGPDQNADTEPATNWTPDRDHPATLGCMCAQVKYALGFPIQVNPPRTGSAWLVYAITGDGEDQSSELVGRGPTEFDALWDSMPEAAQ